MAYTPIERDANEFRDGLKWGKALCKRVPRSSHGDWTPAADRRDPIELLQAQDEGRLQHLLPIKYGRMLDRPLPFCAVRRR